MDANNICSPPSEEDLRAAIREMKTFVDVTEEDLKKIFEIALRHAHERAASRIPVKDIMTTVVVTVGRDADAQEAARILSERGISGMPVVDEQNRVIGVISEADILTLAGLKRESRFKDILRGVLGEPVPARERGGSKVGDVMSAPPITTRADDDIAAAARVLDERRIKRLPVVDEQGRLLGVISRADIVREIGKKP